MRVRHLASALLSAGFCLAVAAQNIQIPQPSAGLMPNMAKGKVLFEKNCASCHGADLRGTSKGPAMLHPFYVPGHHSDIAFQVAAKYGSRAHHWQFGDMPPVPTVTPDDVAHITVYIRAEQRKVGLE